MLEEGGEPVTVLLRLPRKVPVSLGGQGLIDARSDELPILKVPHHTGLILLLHELHKRIGISGLRRRRLELQVQLLTFPKRTAERVPKGE